MRAAVVVGLSLSLWKWCCTKTPKTVTNSIGMKLIKIPAGTFMMGSPVGEKGHEADEKSAVVTLTHPFSLSMTVVTQAQWKKVMHSEPWGEEVPADEDCPATCVSWDDALDFCETLTSLELRAGKLKANRGYRLPTEAEWEYACRAGTTTAFSFGDEAKLTEHAWWEGVDSEALKVGRFEAGPGNAPREQYARKVGMKKPNPWGFHDMHGNVLEWCWDWSGEKLSGGTNPVGPEGGFHRVSRGGSWRSYPDDCRSAYRFSRDPLCRNDYLGFRVVCSQLA